MNTIYFNMHIYSDVFEIFLNCSIPSIFEKDLVLITLSG